MKKYKKLIKELLKAQSIAIFIHEYPDGDAIGSSSALYLYLKSKNKNVKLFSQDSVPFNMKWVSCAEEYQSQVDLTKTFDLGVIIDCSDAKRPGDKICEQMKSCKQIIRIDHHPNGEVCSKFDVVSPSTSSACELLTEVLLECHNAISKDIANSLLFGILTDTCSLQNSNAHKRTVDIISLLMGKGADLNKLEEYAFAQTSVKEVEISKEFYKNMVLLIDEKIAYSFVGNEVIQRIGATKEDMNGHANILRNIMGVDLSFVIYEIQPHFFSASLRSVEGVACNKIAAEFGGGGHVVASGFKCEANSMEEIVAKTLDCCRKEMLCQTE